jgi:hypothetical protein
MKITTVTTIELTDADRAAAVCHATKLEQETGHSVGGIPIDHGDVLDEDHTCNQCGDPLTPERVSGQPGMSEAMCEDCHLEYVNPCKWTRRHRND